MSDELNVRREAHTTYWQFDSFPVVTQTDAADAENAAAVIRTYGDQRHAQGYAQAVADVVEWLRDRAKADRANSSDCRSGNAGKTLIRFARRREDDAAEITQRFGKDA